MCVSVYVTSGDLTVKLSMSILLRYARRVGFLPAAWRRRPRRRRKGRKIPSYIWHHIHNRVPYVVDSFYIADYVDCTSKHYFIYYHVYYCTPLITVRNSLYGYIIITVTNFYCCVLMTEDYDIGWVANRGGRTRAETCLFYVYGYVVYLFQDMEYLLPCFVPSKVWIPSYRRTFERYIWIPSKVIFTASKFSLFRHSPLVTINLFYY